MHLMDIRFLAFLWLSLLYAGNGSSGMPIQKGLSEVCGKTFKVTPRGFRCSTPVTVSMDEAAAFRFIVDGKTESSVYISTQFEHGSHSLTLVLPDGNTAPVKMNPTGSSAFLEYSNLQPGEYTIEISALTPVCATMLWVQVVPDGNHPFLHPRDKEHMTSFYNTCCLDSKQEPLTSGPCKFLHDTVITRLPSRRFCQSIPNTCDLNGHITSLKLTHGGPGAFSCGVPPRSLGQLMMLQQLDLSGNGLEWDMTDIVNVWDTKENEQNLMRMHLSLNNITGKLDCKFLQLFPHMESFRLEENKISGTVPSCFLSTRTIQELDVSDNELEGSIPDIADGSPLAWICLSNNQLSGPVPASLSKAGALSYVDLSGNGLTGSMPTIPGNVQLLDARDNKLSVLPDGSCAEAVNLKLLDVSNNQLQGTVPSDLLQLPALVALHISSNQLGGPLDLDWATPYLRVLHADNNTFAGFLPKALASGRLYDLQLHHNKLNGPLSMFAAAIPVSNQLLQLNVSHNQLEGVLPDSLQRLAATQPHDIVAFGALGQAHVLDVSHNKLKDVFPDWLITRMADPSWKPGMQMVLNNARPDAEADNTIYCPIKSTLSSSDVATVSKLYSGNCVLPQNGTQVTFEYALGAAVRGELLPGPPDLMSVYAPVRVDATITNAAGASSTPAASTHKKSGFRFGEVGIALIVVFALLVLVLLEVFVFKIHRRVVSKGSCCKVNMADFPEEVHAREESQSLPVLSKTSVRSSSAPVIDAEVGLARTRVAG